MSDQKTLHLKIDVPAKLEGLYEPGYRYYVAYGGRGGTKTWTYAKFLLVLAMSKTLRILCGREFQNSIDESVFKILESTIVKEGWSQYFEVGAASIRSLTTGSEFIFKGLARNILSIKSLEDVDICWVAEAQSVTKESWDILIPTIRKPGSYFLIEFNTGSELDETYQRFVVNQQSDTKLMFITYLDNPWPPAELVAEAEKCKRLNIQEYNHIWLGMTREAAGNTVFQKSWIQHFTPKHTEHLNIYITVDPANEKKELSDFTVFTVWGLGSDRNYYVLTWVRDKLNLTERAEALFRLVHEWRPKVVGYERYGMMADVQYIREQMNNRNYRFPIVELGGPMKKQDRIKRLVPLFQSSRVWVPETCVRQTIEGQKDIVKEFLKEFYSFNDVSDMQGHDDILDCMARITDEALGATFPINLPNPVYQGPRREYDPIQNFISGGRDNGTGNDPFN